MTDHPPIYDADPLPVWVEADGTYWGVNLSREEEWLDQVYHRSLD